MGSIRVQHAHIVQPQHKSPTLAPPSLAQNTSVSSSTDKALDSCSTSTMIHLVASMLQELVTINDPLSLTQFSYITRFHSRSPPRISIHAYLARLTHFCQLQPAIILSIIYYIDLLCCTYKAFHINSLTVHRFVLTAAVVASKGLCDTLCTNAHYAKVGGLSKQELNGLEMEFLVRVDYRIVPKVEKLETYFERLMSRMEEQQRQRQAKLESVTKEIAITNKSKTMNMNMRRSKDAAIPAITARQRHKLKSSSSIGIHKQAPKAAQSSKLPPYKSSVSDHSPAAVVAKAQAQAQAHAQPGPAVLGSDSAAPPSARRSSATLVDQVVGVKSPSIGA